MQTVTAAMQTALVMRSATSLATVNRQPLWLYEIYPRDYFPAENGAFDPTDAVALFAEVGVTAWSHVYRRQVLSRDAVRRFFGEQINNVSVTFANADNYMSAFVLANNIEGMRLVIRYADRQYSATLADSSVIFVGRIEPPRQLDEEQCVISAAQEIGNKQVQVPRRTFSVLDPDGR